MSIIEYVEKPEKNRMEINSDDQKNDLQKKIRLNTVTKQFEEAMNMLLGTNFSFRLKVTDDIQF